MADKKGIVKADRDAMNRLYASEMKKLAGDSSSAKTAAGEGPEDPQAFEDHKAYISTVENVLRDDKGQSWDPNDMLQD